MLGKSGLKFLFENILCLVLGPSLQIGGTLINSLGICLEALSVRPL